MLNQLLQAMESTNQYLVLSLGFCKTIGGNPLHFQKWADILPLPHVLTSMWVVHADTTHDRVSARTSLYGLNRAK